MNYKAIILLFSVPCAHAMKIDSVPTVSNRRNNRDNFLKKPIVPINGCFDKLPVEVQGKIIKTIFNLVIDKNQESKKHSNQKIVQAFGLSIPIFLGVKFCNEFYQMQNFCDEEIGGKKFLAQELFVLPRQEKEVFIRMAHYPILASGNISSEDYVIIKKMSQNDIKKGLRLKVNLVEERLDCINNASYIGIALGMVGQFFAPSLLGCIGIGGASVYLFSQALIVFNHGSCCIDNITFKLHRVKEKEF